MRQVASLGPASFLSYEGFGWELISNQEKDFLYVAILLN